MAETFLGAGVQVWKAEEGGMRNAGWFREWVCFVEGLKFGNEA